MIAGNKSGRNAGVNENLKGRLRLANFRNIGQNSELPIRSSEKKSEKMVRNRSLAGSRCAGADHAYRVIVRLASYCFSGTVSLVVDPPNLLGLSENPFFFRS